MTARAPRSRLGGSRRFAAGAPASSGERSRSISGSRTCDRMRGRSAMHPSVPRGLVPAVVAVALASASIASASPNASPAAAAKPAKVVAGGKVVAGAGAKGDSSGGHANDLVLKGGDEGTVFRTLTVEGEDRIHIEVERPTLRLDMDPGKAPGLDRGTVADVLDRTTPDLEAPLLASSARAPSPWVAHAW